MVFFQHVILGNSQSKESIKAISLALNFEVAFLMQTKENANIPSLFPTSFLSGRSPTFYPICF